MAAVSDLTLRRIREGRATPEEYAAAGMVPPSSGSLISALGGINTSGAVPSSSSVTSMGGSGGDRLEQFFDVIGQTPDIGSGPDIGAIEARIAGVERPNIQQLLATARTEAGDQSPLRQLLEGQVGGYLSGEEPISNIPMYGSGRSTLEAQIANARERLAGSTAKGGGQIAAMGELELGRARGLGDLESRLFEQMYGTGTELAKLRSGETGSLQQALLGLAGQTYGQDIGAALGLGELESDIFKTKTGAATDIFRSRAGASAGLATTLADIYRDIGQSTGFGQAVQSQTLGSGGTTYNQIIPTGPIGGGSSINPNVLSGFTNEPSIFGEGYWDTPSSDFSSSNNIYADLFGTQWE